MASPDRHLPTVVVARSPRPGREREFERWLRRLAAGARHAPGHVATEVQPPGLAHPDEWVVVFQFIDVDSLDGWLTSSRRRELMAAGEPLMVGDQREQRFALAEERDLVTAVASFRLRSVDEPLVGEIERRLHERLARFPGFARLELLEPVPGVQDDLVVVFSFDTREHLDAWLGSDVRRRLLDELAPFVEGPSTVNVVGGFGGWFRGIGGVGPRRWKQACVVLLALVPTSVAITVVRRWLLPDLPWLGAVVLGNVLGVAVLTWVLMPWLTRLLAGWLRR